MLIWSPTPHLAPASFQLGGKSYPLLSSDWKPMDSSRQRWSKIWILIPQLQFDNSLILGNLKWVSVSSSNEIQCGGGGSGGDLFLELLGLLKIQHAPGLTQGRLLIHSCPSISLYISTQKLFLNYFLQSQIFICILY